MQEELQGGEPTLEQGDGVGIAERREGKCGKRGINVARGGAEFLGDGSACPEGRRHTELVVTVALVPILSEHRPNEVAEIAREVAGEHSAAVADSRHGAPE